MYGDIKPIQRTQGANRIIPVSIQTVIKELLDEDCSVYLDEVQAHLQDKHNLLVSLSTIFRAVQAMGYILGVSDWWST